MSESKKNVRQDKYNEVFPTRLRKLIIDNNYTTSLVANEVGVSRQVISQWQNGDTQPNVEKLKKLCDFFNVSANYLIGLTDNETINFEIDAISNMTGICVENLLELCEKNKHRDSIQGLMNNSYFNFINTIIEFSCEERIYERLYKLEEYNLLLPAAELANNKLEEDDIIYYKLVKGKKMLDPIIEAELNLLLTLDLLPESIEATFFLLSHLITDELSKNYDVNRMVDIAEKLCDKSKRIDAYIDAELNKDKSDDEHDLVEEWITNHKKCKNHLLNYLKNIE